MRKFYALLALVQISTLCLGQTLGITWQQTIGGREDDNNAFSLKTIDNNIITGSYAYSGGVAGSYDILIEKRNFDGILQWRKKLGGSGSDFLDTYYYNSDGSILIVGSTSSKDGDMSGNHGLYDIWICKLDNSGTILWQKCFGGSNQDEAKGIFKASDGNYIVTGLSSSNDGDLTSNYGSMDIWVFKMSENGVIQWQKNLGGSSWEGDATTRCIGSADGSIYLLTDTRSNDGDVSGNHGTWDLWLVKLNQAGVLQWQQCFGGSLKELATDIVNGPGGDVYVVGRTTSSTLPAFHGGYDFYFCRVSSSGNLLWSKCYGSPLDDEPCQIVSVEADGSSTIGGYVKSNGGDVSGHHGNSDIWMLNISSTGAIQWQKTLGGTAYDKIASDGNDGIAAGGAVIRTSDQGFLIAGLTESNDGDISGFHQPSVVSREADIWVVKLNSNGILEWQRSLGGQKADVPAGFPIELSPADFLIIGSSNSNNGDVSTNYGSFDTWLVRLGAVNKLTGIVFLDNNLNGTKDPGEPLYSDVIIKSEKGSSTKTTVPFEGIFIGEVDTGTYITTVKPYLPYYNIVPVSHSSQFLAYFNTDSFSFALQPIPNKQDLIVNVFSLNAARPGFNTTYQITYKNIGTTAISAGEILFKKDSRLSLVTTNRAISSVNGDTLKWAYSNFAPGDTGSIQLELKLAVPPAANNGDTITSIAIITPVAGDETPTNDSSSIKQRLTGSFDPNDKNENNAGSIIPDFITTGKYLQYVIRFQNTGTDTAFTVIVKDTLDSKLDWSSLEMIAASHAYSFSIDNDKLSWEFNNIRLPHSSINEHASHGYIVYRIKPKSTVVLNDVIHNTASIYFDFNLPVITNDASIIVLDNFSILPVSLLEFNGNLIHKKVNLNWKTADNDFKKIEVQRSINRNDFSTIGTRFPASSYSFEDNISGLSSTLIYYRLKLEDLNGKISYSNIIFFRQQDQLNDIVVFPNPASSNVFVSFYSSISGPVEVKLVDINGKAVKNWQKNIQKGQNVLSLNTQAFPAGNYTVQLIQQENIINTKILIVK
jgi:uncharacterized repeat protein (TIGR01451 family)